MAMKYQLLKNKYSYDLSDEVQDLLDKGWEPYGSPFSQVTDCGGGILRPSSNQER